MSRIHLNLFTWYFNDETNLNKCLKFLIVSGTLSKCHFKLKLIDHDILLLCGSYHGIVEIQL